MLESVSAKEQERTLLLDFCGDHPLLALMQGDIVRRSERLGERRAAAEWLPTLKRMLQAEDWTLLDLDTIGVVAGPGSFTGVRVAVAAGKGLSEAAPVRLALVSRLAVLAHAAGDPNAVAVLYAGRDQVYLRTPAAGDQEAHESLATLAEVEALACARAVVIAEPGLAKIHSVNGRFVELCPEAILRVVRDVLRQKETDAAAADANYVRSEGEIYRKRAVGTDIKNNGGASGHAGETAAVNAPAASVSGNA